MPLQHLNTSSSSSVGSSARICRICHVVERCSSSASPRICRSSTPPPANQSSSLLASVRLLLHRHVLSDKHRHLPSAPRSDMIAPCECRGTMRHVHRECLNRWRLASSRTDSFVRCEQCFAVYQFKDSWLTATLTSPACVYTATALILVLWILASVIITTNGDAVLFSLLPPVLVEEHTVHVAGLQSLLHAPSTTPVSFTNWFLQLLTGLLHHGNRIVYGLIFVALTEFIFFTPSFILSFNTLFCIWRIQRYELFFDKWLLAAFVTFGLYRAVRSIHHMLDSFANRVIKLRILEVLDRDEQEPSDDER